MGTHVFFEKDEEKPVDELYAKCDNYYKFSGKTNKILKMSRVLIKSNEMDSGVANVNDIDEIKNHLQVQKTYEQALNLLLPPDREQPRTIPEDFNCEKLLCPSSSLKQEAEARQCIIEVNPTDNDEQ